VVAGAFGAGFANSRDAGLTLVVFPILLTLSVCIGGG
jgi:hypothetical protein